MCIRDSGGAGHALEMAKLIGPGGTLSGIDQDEVALAAAPVSYTHLDVYKRQVEGRSGAPPHRFRVHSVAAELYAPLYSPVRYFRVTHSDIVEDDPEPPLPGRGDGLHDGMAC